MDNFNKRINCLNDKIDYLLKIATYFSDKFHKEPNKSIDLDKENRDELGEYFTQNKKDYMDHVIDHYSTQLINKLGMHGFEIYDEDFIKRFSYTMETLRSTLYLSLDIYHPFKEHIEEIIVSFKEDIGTPDEFPEDDVPESA